MAPVIQVQVDWGELLTQVYMISPVPEVSIGGLHREDGGAMFWLLKSFVYCAVGAVGRIQPPQSFKQPVGTHKVFGGASAKQSGCV
jgi:hypothetical protein